MDGQMKEKETKTQLEEQPKKKKVWVKILNTVVNILIVMVLIVSIFIAVLSLSSKSNGISTVFGYTIQPIQSDSMKGGSPDGYPGGDFGAGDLMIAKASNFSGDVTYEKGDIVTFRSFDNATNKDMLIVHRIVDVQEDAVGNISYQTQGDNRETSPVPDQQQVENYISAAQIGSVFYSDSYHGTILKGWGKVLDFLGTQKGFFFVVLLPMILFFLYELIRVVLNFSNYKKAKSEEEKEEAVKEAVAAAKADEGDIKLPDGITEDQVEQFKQFIAAQNKVNEEQPGIDGADAQDAADALAKETAAETEGE